MDIEETQKERDAAFARILDEIQNMYHEKNIKYNDAFMTANQSVADAFIDIKAKTDLLETALRYEAQLFKKEKFINDLKDLASYSVMMIVYIEENVK